ncbi:uncharacterized protein [Dendropsophus ebraccatus]|uniref:uncharacterized protein n=1 Tax=Dendropsophus ebraccatus TaxID=150705 RepID=UPI00383122E2
MKVLLSAVLVFGLVSTGLSLVCVKCENSTVASCSGNLRNCTDQTLCMSTITQTTAADGQKTFTFERDCGDADQCNTTGSMTSYISTETHHTCCNTDSCTPPQPTLSTEKRLQNNIQCPVCISHIKGQCPLSNVRNCTGDQKYCARYVVKSDSESTIIMGCASESFCRTAETQKLLDGKITQVVATCIRSGSDSLKAHVFHHLPALLGTLVYIVFYV